MRVCVVKACGVRVWGVRGECMRCEGVGCGV